MPGHEIYVLGVPDSEFEFLLPPPDGKWTIRKKEIPAQWGKNKIAQFVPMSLKLVAHSAQETINHWKSHVRATYRSISSYNTVREFGAYVVNLNRGHLSLDDVVKGFVRYVKANYWFVAKDILMLAVTFSLLLMNAQHAPFPISVWIR
uniref:Uncharacterized protein n=1 Tax=Ditylum brightwellii TaxID=49249 RepID=A0A7S1Z9E1_9STRA